MRLYRIGPARYLENYRGLGASYQDGARWNNPGLPILYFGASASVAMLEMANYLPSPRLVPDDYRLGVYEIDDDVAVQSWSVADLPEQWNTYPHQAETQQLGSQWLTDMRSALLLVPSAAVPGGLENNILVNPLHPDAKGITLVASQDKLFSDRLFSV